MQSSNSKRKSSDWQRRSKQPKKKSSLIFCKDNSPKTKSRISRKISHRSCSSRESMTKPAPISATSSTKSTPSCLTCWPNSTRESPSFKRRTRRRRKEREKECSNASEKKRENKRKSWLWNTVLRWMTWK